MRTTFRTSFTRDLKKIMDRHVLRRLKQKIEEIEAIDGLNEVREMTKISGHSTLMTDADLIAKKLAQIETHVAFASA